MSTSLAADDVALERELLRKESGDADCLLDLDFQQWIKPAHGHCQK